MAADLRTTVGQLHLLIAPTSPDGAATGISGRRPVRIPLPECRQVASACDHDDITRAIAERRLRTRRSIGRPFRVHGFVRFTSSTALATGSSGRVIRRVRSPRRHRDVPPGDPRSLASRSDALRTSSTAHQCSHRHEQARSATTASDRGVAGLAVTAADRRPIGVAVMARLPSTLGALATNAARRRRERLDEMRAGQEAIYEENLKHAQRPSSAVASWARTPPHRGRGRSSTRCPTPGTPAELIGEMQDEERRPRGRSSGRRSRSSRTPRRWTSFVATRAQ